jgi:hypothetical protein
LYENFAKKIAVSRKNIKNYTKILSSNLFYRANKLLYSGLCRLLSSLNSVLEDNLLKDPVFAKIVVFIDTVLNVLIVLLPW